MRVSECDVEGFVDDLVVRWRLKQGEDRIREIDVGQARRHFALPRVARLDEHGNLQLRRSPYFAYHGYRTVVVFQTFRDDARRPFSLDENTFHRLRAEGLCGHGWPRRFLAGHLGVPSRLSGDNVRRAHSRVAGVRNLYSKAVCELILFIENVRISGNGVADLNHHCLWRPARSLTECPLGSGPSL